MHCVLVYCNLVFGCNSCDKQQETAFRDVIADRTRKTIKKSTKTHHLVMWPPSLHTATVWVFRMRFISTHHQASTTVLHGLFWPITDPKKSLSDGAIFARGFTYFHFHVCSFLFRKREQIIYWGFTRLQLHCERRLGSQTFLWDSKELSCFWS